MPYGRARRSTRRPTRRRSFARKRSYQTRSFAATRIQRAVRSVRKRFQRAKIQRAVRPLLETKQRQLVLFGNQTATQIEPVGIPGHGLGTGMVNTGGKFSTNIWPDLTMALDVKQTGRIGMKIQNCRLTATICMTANIYNSTTNTSQYPCDVYMIVLRDRTEKSCIVDQLKMQPNGTTYFIDGSAQNAFLPFNKEKYIIYSNKRVARFRPPARAVRSQPDPVPGDMLENPQTGGGIRFKNFRVSLPCPKELRFTPAYGGASVTPDYLAPVNASMAVGFYYIDGSGLQVASNQAPVSLTCTLKLTYTDA